MIEFAELGSKKPSWQTQGMKIIESDWKQIIRTEPALVENDSTWIYMFFSRCLLEDFLCFCRFFYVLQYNIPKKKNEAAESHINPILCSGWPTPIRSLHQESLSGWGLGIVDKAVQPNGESQHVVLVVFRGPSWWKIWIKFSIIFPPTWWKKGFESTN